MPFPELLSLNPRTRQRLAGWTCVLSYGKEGSDRVHG
jgi:hypothetical protein